MSDTKYGLVDYGHDVHKQLDVRYVVGARRTRVERKESGINVEVYVIL